MAVPYWIIQTESSQELIDAAHKAMERVLEQNILNSCSRPYVDSLQQTKPCHTTTKRQST